MEIQGHKGGTGTEVCHPITGSASTRIFMGSPHIILMQIQLYKYQKSKLNEHVAAYEILLIRISMGFFHRNVIQTLKLKFSGCIVALGQPGAMSICIYHTYHPIA